MFCILKHCLHGLPFISKGKVHLECNSLFGGKSSPMHSHIFSRFLFSEFNIDLCDL